MILISFLNSIKKIKINNNKIKIEDYLNNIEVSKPGIVIKYQDENAWTNGKYINFSFSPQYNLKNYFEENYYDYETSYYFKVINLIQFFDDILFIFSLKSIEQMFVGCDLMLGSYKNSFGKYKYLNLETYNFEALSNDDDRVYYESTEKNYNIYISNYKELIIAGKLGIYIINPIEWEIRKKIIFNDKLIENTFYLNDSTFLIFLNRYLFRQKYYQTESKKSEIINTIYKDSDLIITKIGENLNQIIFETFLNCPGNKIYYKYNINSHSDNLINKFISFQNKISEYEFIDTQKILEMKSN